MKICKNQVKRIHKYYLKKKENKASSIIEFKLGNKRLEEIQFSKRILLYKIKWP